MTAPAPAPSPTQKPPRLVVPDLARGLALWGIAMANLTTFWIMNSPEGAIGKSLGWVDPDSASDRFAALFSGMLVHTRGLPMFATLLGFGIGLLTSSLHRKNYPVGKATRVLVKRYGILAVFGLLHMYLLFNGDIMFTYGLAGMLIATMIKLSSKTLRIFAAVSFCIALLLSTMSVITALAGVDVVPEFTPTEQITTAGTYFITTIQQAPFFMVNSTFAVLAVLCVMLIGFIWAREGVLANVDANRKTLTFWAGLAVVISLVVGIPWGLTAIGVINDQLDQVFMALNMGVGTFTGPGILALVALATNGIQKRMYDDAAAGRPVAAPKILYPFVALGKRSMSGYIAQSFLFIILVMPFGFGLGVDSTISEKLLIATGVWLITLVLAVILEATNTPGPFEWVHRRLAYGRTGKLEPYAGAYNGPHDAGQAPGEHARRPVGEGRGALPTPPPGGQFEVEGGGHR